MIYIHSHDSGKFIGPYGYHLETPHLEELAESSAVFHNAFAVAPTCSPSRSSLLTSTYPHENGMLGLVNRGFMMHDYNQHFVRWLNHANYETALCGIQHEAAHYHESEKAAKIIGYQNNLTTHTVLADLEDKRVWDQENTRNAINWLTERKAENNFFLSLGFYCSHRPYPKVEQGTETKRGVPNGFPSEQVILEDFEAYNQSISHVDQCVGQVVQRLKKLGIFQNTILIFTTDHGIAYPFGKNNLTDLGLEVSLIVHLPTLDKRKDITGLVSQLDVVPTLCDYLQIQPEFPVRGKSLRPLIERSEEVNQTLFFEMNFHTSYEPARAVRSKRFKYIEYLEDYERYQLSNINDSRVKDFYIENGLGNCLKAKKQFYDLYLDPDEKNNRINHPEYFEEIQTMQKQLMTWRNETNDYEVTQLQWSSDWVVNKRTSEKQKGRSSDDYIPGHVPKRLKE
ncbi:sulfatase family protein [Enterococcus sp. LJL98]